MARTKLPINILFDRINQIRGTKLSKKLQNKIKEHLDNSIIHKTLFDRREYDTLAQIMLNYIIFWNNNENNN